MANGRLGFKCIPAYSSCEIYQNSSGSQASISIGAQGLNASVNNTISVAAGTTAYCLVSSQNEAVGTNCFKDTSAITVAGTGQTDPHGAWIQSSTAIGGTVSTRPTSFMNPNGTRTSIAGTALLSPAPYGGSERILPGEDMFADRSEITNGADRMVHKDAFMTFDCHGIRPLFIGSKNFCCCCEFAGAMFINPQCDCAGANFGYGDVNVSSPCMIYHQSFSYFSTPTACTECSLYAINSYAPPFYIKNAGEVCIGTAAVCLVCRCGGAESGTLQPPVVGFFAGCCGQVGTANGTYLCALRVFAGGCCCAVSTCFFGFRDLIPCCCLGTCKNRLAVALSVCGDGVMACNQPCCNLGTSNLMSPYGVARAATYGESLFAMKTCGGVTRYLSAYPGCQFQQQLSLCSCVNWEVLDIAVPDSSGCEYPIKYLAYNPKVSVEKTYFMVRSSKQANCGIFEYKFADYIGEGLCTGTCICTQEGTENQNAFFKRTTVTDSPYIEKVADFPSVMTATKYITPLMCVGCLYRMSPKANPFWSITVYNHDTTEWDRFTTEDLISWKSVAPDFTWNVSTTFKYETFDNCLRTSCNNFNDVVPKCGYFDFGVSTNNYERTGVVISDGESVIVNNDTTEGLAAQVWGYEG